MPLQRTPIRFGPFCLHPTQGLARDGQEIRITPKSQAVLHTLAERAGQIVTKGELLRAVWPSTLVTDAALSSCISELRRALHDDARQPRYIETVHRRGFRLLASCMRDAFDGSDREIALAPLVGRSTTLAELVRLQDRTRNGSSEIVFITGAAGVGKTALVETFLADIARRDSWPIARVACIEGSGTGAAYRPLLQVLAQLCRRSDGAEVISVLRRCAPTWLAELWEVQLPAELSALRQRTCGATSKQLWRELNEALAVLTSDAPMVLCIDDLQWSDAATIAWIEAFARNPGRATVLLIAISRTASAPSSIRESCAIMGGTVVELQPLDRAAIADYLRTRLPAERVDEPSFEPLVDRVFGHCRGEPWRLAEVTDWLAQVAPVSHREGGRATAHGAAARSLDLRSTVEAMIERRLERLTPEQLQTLEAASVAGKSFTVAEVAACGGAVADVEDALAQLGTYVARGPQVTWPDGTTTPTFWFRHGRDRCALLERVALPQRAVLHRRIGRRLETAYGDRAIEMASELAMHFEHASDLARAVEYLHHAGDNARRRSAPAIAARHYRRALVLLESLPASAERDLSEARLRLALGRELVAMQGLTADEVGACYERAKVLQESIESKSQRCAVLWGLWVYYLSRGPLETAKQLADRHFELAQQLGDPALLLESHHGQWGTALMMGDVNAVLVHTGLGMAVCGSRADHSLAMTSGCMLHEVHLDNHHAAVCAGFFSAWADALAGRNETALRSLDAAIVHARDVEHPFTLAVALVFAAGVVAAGEVAGTCRRYASEGRALAADHGFEVLQAFAAIYEGWALVRLGDTEAGLTLMQDGLAAHRDTGLSLLRPFQLALAADAQLRCGMLDASVQSLEEGFAIANQSGHRMAIAELHRLRGELALATSSDDAARERARHDLSTAVEIASAQGATLLAARASRPLQRLQGGSQKVSTMILKTAR